MTNPAENRTIRANSFSFLTATPCMNETTRSAIKYAGLLRRFAAMAYDALLLTALLIAATAPVTLFTGGEATRSGNPFVTTWLFLVSFAFFAWFWTHGGQTLGMRAWKIRLQREDGRSIDLWQALLRFLTGLPAWAVFVLGILLCTSVPFEHLPALLRRLHGLPCPLLLAPGLLWLVIDHWPNSWRDRFTHTRVLDVREEVASAKAAKQQQRRGNHQ